MKRGAKRLILGSLLVIAAPLWVVITFSSLHRGEALEEQFMARGTFAAKADDAGRYYIWDNYKTVFNGEKVGLRDDFPDEVLFVVRDAEGQELEFIRDAGESWSIGNHAKASIGYIDTPGPGSVTVEVQGGNGERVLSLSKADMGGELWQRLRGFAFAAISFFVGLPIAIWGIVLTLRKSKTDTAPDTPRV